MRAYHLLKRWRHSTRSRSPYTWSRREFHYSKQQERKWQRVRWEYQKNYRRGLAGTNRKVTREANISLLRKEEFKTTKRRVKILPCLLAFPSSLVCFFGCRVKATCNCNSSFALPPASTEDRLVGTKDDRFFIPQRELLPTHHKDNQDIPGRIHD